MLDEFLKQNCPFCEIIKGSENNALIIWENDFVSCFLPLEMEVFGHILVLPKRHFDNIFDIDEAAMTELAKGVRFMANRLKETLKADGVNILNANGKVAGQSVEHLHFHLMPRFENDQLDLWPKIPKEDFDRVEVFNVLRKK